MDQEKIGKIIKKIRNDNNLTQEQFANIFGVTYQAVSKWENGKNIPDISIVKAISDHFNVSLEGILKGNINVKQKSSDKKLLLLILSFVIILLLSIIIILAIKHKDHNDFEFKQIGTSCESFTLTGSMAYTEDKTSIRIYSIAYCGKENNELYDKITCNLYETSDNMNNLITSCKENKMTTIKDFLNNVNIGVNNYSSICRKYDNTSLYLEVEAYKGEEITKYKIPITIDDNC